MRIKLLFLVYYLSLYLVTQHSRWNMTRSSFSLIVSTASHTNIILKDKGIKFRDFMSHLKIIKAITKTLYLKTFFTMLKMFYHDLILVGNSVLSDSFTYLTSPFTRFSNFCLYRYTDKGTKDALTLQRDDSAVKGSAHKQMPKVPWTSSRKAHVGCSWPLIWDLSLPTVTLGCSGCKGCFWSNPNIQDPFTYNHFPSNVTKGRWPFEWPKLSPKA